VTTAKGSQSVVNTVLFTYQYPPPVISAANPRVVQAPGGGTLVTLRGSYFGPSALSAVSIFVDGDACIASTWVSESEATCVTPPRAASAAGSRILLKISADGLVSNATDIGLAQGFRYATTICSPVCDWNEECSPSGFCNLCAPGFVGTGCKQRLFTLTPPEELVTSEDGLTAEAVVTLNADLPAALPLDIVTYSSNENEGLADPVTFPAGSKVGTTRRIKFRGVADLIRDGAALWTATVAVISSAPPEFSLVMIIVYFATYNFFITNLYLYPS
jgi:hypothetical protein